MNTVNNVANFNGQRPVIDPGDAVLLLIDRELLEGTRSGDAARTAGLCARVATQTHAGVRRACGVLCSQGGWPDGSSNVEQGAVDAR